MDNCQHFIFLVLVLSPVVFASDNGLYYKCDETKLANNNQCIFAYTGAQPEDWLPAVEEHNVTTDVGDDFYRGIQSYDGKMLSVSPKPWVNGDTLVESSTKIEGDNWTYSLIFELMAPLRDMMMYRPDDLDAATWAKYTRALTDCNAKTVDYVAERGGAQLSTTQVYDIMKDPKNKDIHHNILQYLEEGSIDLVCLSTELEMTHCDGTRDASGGVGKRCNCWFDAYEAIYGACPVVDEEFQHCDLTTAPTVCTGESEGTDGGDNGTNNGPPDGMPDRGGHGRRRR